ncbi:dipeptide epimerase [Kordiimonas aquimaris]|uniref:dipeptide epimerase n=1 Tax=Kordiimonas aquimaris TaxID=707591 RepID=UPI0021D12037|nr:dipeptide epimerase [Kordiimonas aquimaris]
MKMSIECKSFPLTKPFAITGYVFENTEAVWVTLEDKGFCGRGEAIGIYYKDETKDTIIEQLEAVRSDIEAGLTRNKVQALLPAGGARNALDCAFWDLQAKQNAQPIWQTLRITPKPLITVATVGIDTPAKMAQSVLSLSKYRHLKIKLSADDPIARLKGIREARPDAVMVVDVNQGWSFDELKRYTPALQEFGIAMIEQPLKRGRDEELEGFRSPVPLGADESCLNLSEYGNAAKRYDVINIKLDKCGGLSEGLEIVKRAQADGKQLMVGNMTGSSLSMAPAYVIGQFCTFVDIDGPLYFEHDIENALEYVEGGVVSIPEPALWG